MSIYYLYVKTHNKTGLKYLGYTSNKNPCEYKGSGVYWSNHISIYGYDVKTKILKELDSKDDIKKWGLYYSRLWNIVESKKWANLKEEQGDGGRQSEEIRRKIAQTGVGRIPWNKGKKIWSEQDRKKIGERNKQRGKQSRKTIAKRVQKNTGKKRSEEQRSNIGKSQKGKVMSQEVREKMSKAAIKRGFNGYGFLKGNIPHNAKSYKIKNTVTNQIFEILSLRKWCIENNLPYGTVWNAFKHNKDYKVYKLIYKS